MNSLDFQLGDFDSDYFPSNPINIEAAKQRGLRFDSIKRVYVDEDGCLLCDEYGQPF